jgi:hypothetical protein
LSERNKLKPFTDQERSQQLEDFTLAAHGAMTTLHGLGAIYHLTRQNYKHCAVHVFGTVYSAVSTYYHNNHRYRLKGDDGRGSPNNG